MKKISPQMTKETSSHRAQSLSSGEPVRGPMKHPPMADHPRRRRARPPHSLWHAALVVVLHLLGSLRAAHGADLDYPTAGLSTKWTSTPTMKHVVSFMDGSQVRSLLLRRNRAGFGHTYAFGFYCRGACNSFLLAIFVVQASSGGGIVAPASGFPQVVWAANRARPVGESATLQLGSDGDLVLADADGTRVWSSGTSGKSVAGLNLTEYGNLVMFGGEKNQTIVWESFAHPTDSLVPGQKLQVGQSLTANASATNSTEGLYYLYANSTGLIPFIKSSTPTRYSSPLAESSGKKIQFFEFMDGNISTSSSGQYMAPTQFLRLESDGHLRVFQWRPTEARWVVVKDLLSPDSYWSNCFYPTVCGRYGICSANEQCGCPQWDGGGSNYFVQIDGRNPSLGCKEATPVTCQSPYNHSLLRLAAVSYFTYDQVSPDISTVDEDGCRNACAKNCSCKASFFRYRGNTSDGLCYLTSEVFSLKNNRDEVTHYNSTAFIKVQVPVTNSTNPSSNSKGSGTAKGVILGSSLGALFLLLLIIGSCILIARKRTMSKRDMAAEDEEVDLEHVSGMPRRFSLEELRSATDGFCKKLGQGGFGSVYEGEIGGKTVAVKRLDGAGQGRKEFLAEVQTIGKIHHVNLVKLIGYCAEKSCRLLVYEFMPNGSLDRWIFSGDQEASLDWQIRCKIILGVAKGLSYLHEECSQRIAHLDIKPQNILLDDRFEAKVSDFGLAKLIDRDQSHVVTRMRGTPGYLAPEWLSSMITEKVDIYSFGVVILEIICGRRNLDRSQPQEDMLLVALLKSKAENGELLGLVDESIKDTYCYSAEEAMKMMQIASWCLQDQNKRPSMSMVVKALEGTIDVESNLDVIPPPLSLVKCNGPDASSSTPLLPSVLSGPR